MARLRRLVLTGVAAVLSGRARAADLPPAPSLPPPSAEAEFSGWYLRGDVGGGVNATAPEFRIAPDTLTPGVAGGSIFSAPTQAFGNATLSQFGMVDIGGGYQFNSSFRADGTIEYRAGANLRSASAAYPWLGQAQDEDAFHADVSSLVGLVNGYVTPGAWYGFSPFLGAGVGFADNRLLSVSTDALGQRGQFGSGSRTSFAWAAMAGVDYDLTANLKLELNYRYLSYGTVTTGSWDGCPCAVGAISSRNRLASSDFRLGVIYLIGDASSGQPAAAPD
jgi:opacity protein-like surface antigen